MEIEMTEIVRGDKAEPILAAKLLTEFDIIESNRHILPTRNIATLRTTAIGNQSKLPQQIRGDRTKKNKAESDAKILEYIAEENMSDKALYEDIQSLQKCCRQGTSTNTNCIIKSFTANDCNQTLQFNDLCLFIRR